jgi:hypothetical protein
MQSWRDKWDIGSIPFLVFQLPGYDVNYDPGAGPSAGTWGYFRLAQEWVTDNNDDAYLVVNVPGGERADIHPQDKEGVGWRASRVALKHLYGQSIVGDGPVLVYATHNGSSVTCTFDNGGAPLMAKEVTVDGLLIPGSSLSGFAILGRTGGWEHATAVITGPSTIEVSSPSVSDPISVMYGMEDFPLCNLFNTEDLPCAPFSITSFTGGGPVPDVIGMAQVTAESTISLAGFTVGTVSTQYSDTVPAGNVISQDPVAGILMAAGSSVDLVVSLGIRGDIDNNNKVNLLDFSILSANWLRNDCDALNDYCQGADIDRLNGVGLDDLILLIENWLFDAI